MSAALSQARITAHLLALLPTNTAISAYKISQDRISRQIPYHTIVSSAVGGLPRWGTGRMRDSMELDDLSIVVERKGFGRQAWHWRLSNGMRDQAVSTCGFPSAEEAYVTGKAHLLQHRSNQAYMRSMTRLRFASEVEGRVYV